MISFPSSKNVAARNTLSGSTILKPKRLITSTRSEMARHELLKELKEKARLISVDARSFLDEYGDEPFLPTADAALIISALADVIDISSQIDLFPFDTRGTSRDGGGKDDPSSN